MTDPYDLRAKFTRFRILVIGRANERRSCNESATQPRTHVSSTKNLLEPTSARGIHDIHRPFTFRSNSGFIFHDSPGFETGDVKQLQDEFLQKWADERLAKTQSLLGREAITHEVEQEGLDLTISTVEKEQELVDEVENVWMRLKRAESRLSKFDALSGPDGCILDDTLPTNYLAMCQTLSSFPPLEPSFDSVNLTEPGKLQWEPSKSGYLNWTVGRLLVKSEAMDKVENSTLEIGSGEDLRLALHASQG